MYGAGSLPTTLSCTHRWQICRDSRWGRCQETSGEDPWLSAAVAYTHTVALQNGSDPDHTQVAVVCKHFDVYGGPEGGASTGRQGERFGFKAELTERVWRTTFLPPFEACIRAGASGIM